MSIKLGYEAIEFAIKKWLMKNRPVSGIATIPGKGGPYSTEKIKHLIDRYANEFKLKGLDINKVTVKQTDDLINEGLALKAQREKESSKQLTNFLNEQLGGPPKKPKDPFQGFTPKIVEKESDDLASGGIARTGYFAGLIAKGAAKAGMGKFTKSEVLIQMLENTLKGSKDAYVKKTFPNFIKELQKNPKLALDENVWGHFTKGLPKNQRLVVHSDDTVDFFRQTEFGPHNIENITTFQKKHPFLTREQATKITKMEPEDQVLEVTRQEALANKSRTKQAAGGIAGQLHMNEGGRIGFHRGSLRHQKEHDYQAYEDEGNFMKYLKLSGDRSKMSSPEHWINRLFNLSTEEPAREDFESYMKERFMYGEHKPPSNFEQILLDVKGLLKKKDEKKAEGGIAGELHLNRPGYAGGKSTFPKQLSLFARPKIGDALKDLSDAELKRQLRAIARKWGVPMPKASGGRVSYTKGGLAQVLGV